MVFRRYKEHRRVAMLQSVAGTAPIVQQKLCCASQSTMASARASLSPSPARGSSKQIRARRRSTAPPSVTARRHRTFKLLRLLSFEGYIYASLTRIKVFKNVERKNVKDKKQVKCVPSTGREDRARLGIWVDGYSNPNCREKMPSKRSEGQKNTKQKKVNKKYERKNGPLSYYYYKYSKGWNPGGHQTHLAKTGTNGSVDASWGIDALKTIIKYV